MTMRCNLSLAALVFGAAIGGAMPAFAQQTITPTDPTSPSGTTCTGFPGDPVECAQNKPTKPNTTIPEDPSAPDVDTRAGQPDDTQTLPGTTNPDGSVNDPTPVQ